MTSVGKRNSPSSRKVVFQAGIPQDVAWRISYMEADRELPELVLAGAAELIKHKHEYASKARLNSQTTLVCRLEELK